MVIEISAIVACLLLASLGVFQLFLALGYPLGKFAWGGAHTVLPKRLRIGSAISILLYLIFAVFILSESGLVDIVTNRQVTSIVIWVLTAYFALGVFMNSISRSKPERAVMTPIALILALCCACIAIN
ncbi:TPA: hypothetical protein DEW05_01535 [Candidatus Saccharibacteria bacterium]|nr:hypothetical protein [Candidatus Saccharibacteria bacterium]